MGEKNHIVENADRLAGVTTLVLIGLGIIQIILGETVSRSVALTANGIDCIGDGFVSAVVWIGLIIYKRPADQKFHYGYYKMENLASIAAAIVMIILAAYIGFRSYNQYIDPHPIKAPLLGAAVAFIAAVVAISLGIYKYKKGKKSNMGSVKLEAFNTIKDGTASGLAVVALILTSFGYIIADAIVGFIIAGIIVTIGIMAIKESSAMLVDACNGACIQHGFAIKGIAKDIEGVEKAHVVRLRQSGPIFQGELEIKVSDDLTVKELNKIKRKINKKVKEVFPEVEKLTIVASEKIESE
jgi:cation diffusion facilitator family transporter